MRFRTAPVMVTELAPDMADLTRADFHHIVETGQRLGRSIARLPVPVIGIARGGAVGGGLELLLRSDFVFCTDAAQFAFPEVTLGFVPVWGGTQWARGGRCRFGRRRSCRQRRSVSSPVVCGQRRAGRACPGDPRPVAPLLADRVPLDEAMPCGALGGPARLRGAGRVPRRGGDDGRWRLRRRGERVRRTAPGGLLGGRHREGEVAGDG
jgi:hypothetical protein